MITGKPIETLEALSGTIEPAVLDGQTPVVLKGLVADWPLARSAQLGGRSAIAYLRKFDRGAKVAISLGEDGKGGRAFYNADMSGVNYAMKQAPLTRVFDRLESEMDNGAAPMIYVGSTGIDEALPGLRGECSMPHVPDHALASVWIGNRTRIAAHYDLPDNIACVAAGRRRFTLFPPDQIDNLYVGPLDRTPAGQSISLVDFEAPDYERFPKFRDAEEAALQATLDPGDAIFIPSLWWHHIEGLDGFNMLINYWWRRAGQHMGTPMNALMHAIMSVRDLPHHEKENWKRLFDHYVFEANEDTRSHIPDNAKGVLGEMDPVQVERMRRFLLGRLQR